MRVILIGSGKLAYFLSKQFASKGYHLTVIDSDNEEAIAFSRNLKAIVIHGEGSNPNILAQAGAYQADVVLALTINDEDNLIACQIAQKEYGVPRTVALVNDPENRPIFEKLGISVAFSATEIIANLIEQQTSSDEIKNLLPVAEGKINVTEIALSESASIAGKTIDELQLPTGTLIASILRQGDVIVPGGDTILQTNDRLILIAQPEYYGQLLRLLGAE